MVEREHTTHEPAPWGLPLFQPLPQDAPDVTAEVPVDDGVRRRSRHRNAVDGFRLVPDDARRVPLDQKQPEAASLSASHRSPRPERPLASGDDLDWSIVQQLREAAGERLAEFPVTDEGTRRERGRDIVTRLVQTHTTDQLRQGRLVAPEQQAALAKAVFDAMLGLGRLQPLVDNPDVENIEINGCDLVTLVMSNGDIVAGPAVAETDDDLIREVAEWCSRAGGGERVFSPQNPIVHLRLPDGSRLAASAWVSPRPAVVIRRHRLTDIDLSDLVARATLGEDLAAFLRAAVRARMSIVVSGAQGAGKTTLVRALCNELDPMERIGTIETEHELFLHEMPDRHPRCTAWETRPGGSERGPDGRAANEVTMSDLLEASFRFNLSRIIVGEVRGREVIPMFQAMQAGAGSLSTTHAGDARGVIDRLVTLGMEAGRDVDPDFLLRQVAWHIDLIVQLTMDDTAGRRRRYISEVIAVEPGEGARPAVTELFAPDASGHAVWTGTAPPFLERLEAFGWVIPGNTSLHGSSAAGRRG